MTTENFGPFLQNTRKQKGLSLRAVEDKTGISNAYLSQLEQGKIKQPSPVILSKLAGVYEISYRVLLDLVGYPTPEPNDDYQLPVSKDFASRLATLTHDEEQELSKYLQFLRSRNSKD